MRLLAAMSGGVDSSVAAALALDAGHDVVGVTLKLWGGETDSGCCTVADADDARRVAQHLGVDHYVWSFAAEFEASVVSPYVEAHRAGRTPNPCVECNRHLKFGALLDRARRLGFDAVVTGHHARLTGGELRRGADPAKDQSYVLAGLTADQLSGMVLPVGHLTKDEVRAEAAARGLRTAVKAESQDLCFVASGGRRAFLADRAPLTPGQVVDTDGRAVGHVAGVELVTVGQRKGLGVAAGEPRYVLDVDPAGRVTVGSLDDLLVATQPLEDVAGPTPGERVWAQVSAHGHARAGTVEADAVSWDEPQPRVAPGQLVAFYAFDDPDGLVVGAATAARR